MRRPLEEQCSNPKCRENELQFMSFQFTLLHFTSLHLFGQHDVVSLLMLYTWCAYLMLLAWCCLLTWYWILHIAFSILRLNSAQAKITSDSDVIDREAWGAYDKSFAYYGVNGLFSPPKAPKHTCGQTVLLIFRLTYVLHLTSCLHFAPRSTGSIQYQEGSICLS